MKYIELKAVMELVQGEREQFRKMLKELGVQPSIKDQLALKHFRNILRRLTVWTEEAKDGIGPIASDILRIYVLYSHTGHIFSAHKSYKEAEVAQQYWKKEYPDTKILLGRADLLDRYF